MIWYAIKVRPGCEFEVARAFRGQGHAALVPAETVARRTRNSRGHVVERRHVCPLISGYLFCDDFRATHKQARGALSIDGVPCRIPHVQLAGLLSWRGRREVEQAPAVLTIGQVVSLVDGGLDGRPLTIASFDSRGRVIASVDMLGGSRTVRVDRKRIAA